MSGNDRNKLCKCGSGKKIKNCFDKKDEDCSLFIEERNNKLITEHKQKEKIVTDFLVSSLADVKAVFIMKSSTNEDFLSSRVQLVIVFTFVDILSNFLFCYIDNKDNNQRKRFETWTKTYLLNSENKIYTKNLKYFKNVSPDKLYDLRSSLTHFFGLPEPEENKTAFILAPNSINAEELDIFCKKINKRNRHLVPLKSQIIFDMVNFGAKIMLNQWIKKVNGSEKDKTEHVLGIHRIHQKINIDGSFVIKKEIFDEITKI